MDSSLVFILLWLTVNVSRGGIINFNPILSDSRYADLDNQVTKLEEEAREINSEHLDIKTLNQFGKQLYENQSVFIVNTGFRLSINLETQAVDISYIDMNENIQQLEILSKKITGHKISEIPVEDLENMERLFSNLEAFYEGHQRLISREEPDLNVPVRQKIWFDRVKGLRHYLISNFIGALFEPESIHSDLKILLSHSPSILHLALPEFRALQDLKPSGNLYLKSPVTDHILTSTRKIQALIKGDLKDFQDVQALHKLAQREFGPMTTGIVGLNEIQIEELRSLVKELSLNPPVYNALIKAFIFQDLGLTPSLRRKYSDKINMADQAQAGALFLKKEKIPKRYGMGKKAEEAFIFLIKNHDRIHHLVRGEFSLHSLTEIINTGNKDLFNAFFVSSLVMFSALGEGLMLEDLATRLFGVRRLCLSIIEGRTTLDDFYKDLYYKKGILFLRPRGILRKRYS